MDAPANERARQHPRFSAPPHRPAVGCLSVPFFPAARCIIPFLTPSLSASLCPSPSLGRSSSLFYSVDYHRLYGARQPPPPSPRSCTECNDRFMGILHSRCTHRFPSPRYTFRSKCYLHLHMRIGESDDRDIMLFYELLNEKENGRSILNSFLTSLTIKNNGSALFLGDFI